MIEFARRTLAATAGLMLAVAPMMAAAETIKVPEGTAFPMRLEETLSSKHNGEGDRFTVTLMDDIQLADGHVIRAGYRGVGEIVDARDNGMLGKTGKLGLRINYVRIGETRIALRGVKDSQGDHNTGVQVATLLLLWPALPFIKGKDTKIRKGTTITAFSDQDVELELPLPDPPPGL